MTEWYDWVVEAMNQNATLFNGNPRLCHIGLIKPLPPPGGPLTPQSTEHDISPVLDGASNGQLFIKRSGLR
ncbi:hypothetical protein VP1G_10609 [Cytospora mali]|uniref:Uncharacterized protein n=1 Tax=Cytospora mali TaxID=578113 RepID=A0A194UQT3_CYTMA|nr:hypothetical protein VP1G_10609 [Valsa mali var. pyri (nom. inval.)]